MSSATKQFKAMRVEERQDGDKLSYSSAIVTRSLDALPAGEVLVKVQYSSLNYKDSLSAAGNKGVTRNYPHTPGIDAAGIVQSSSVDTYAQGDVVIITGYDLGMNTDGGFAEYVRVPAAWLVPLPNGLSAYEAMVLGTAGLTAALCVDKLLNAGLTTDAGAILVTGATGGVGSVAVALLAQLGFAVTAATGKAEAADFLRSLGAKEIIDRQELQEVSSRPLLKERWAGAVDVVGGPVLWNVMKALQYGGSVACCGLVGSPALEASVFPFILRGVNLLGVDSVNVPQPLKAAMWRRLATDWKLEQLDTLAEKISFDELESRLNGLLEGQGKGRMVLAL